MMDRRVASKKDSGHGAGTPAQAIAENGDIFRILAGLAPVGIYLATPEGDCEYANPRWCEMAGLSMDEALGTGWAKGIHPADRDSVFRAWQAMVATQGVWGHEYRFQTRDGKITWVHGMATPHYDSRGKLIRYVGVNVDITDRREAEAAIREAEWKFRALFEKGPIGVAYHQMIYDGQGTPVDYRFLDANERYRELTGVDPCGKTVREAFPGIEKEPFDWIGTFGQVARTGKEIRVEQYLQHNGRWYDVVGYQYRPDHFVAAFLDISARKQAENKLRVTVAELARSNKDLEQFVSVASHDLKEPLRMITGFVSLLKERCHDQLDAKSLEFIDYAEEGGLRLQRLVDDLLAYSHVGQNSRRERVNVGSAVSDALKNLQAGILESGAEITVAPLPVIDINPTELTQVFQNLIGNAIKFHRQGVKPKVHVSGGLEDGQWLFKVADNGIGISREYHDKIFEIFQRLHVQEAYPGTGIGLAVCKKIVERQGGLIWVEEKTGEGSVFAFSLPA